MEETGGDADGYVPLGCDLGGYGRGEGRGAWKENEEVPVGVVREEGDGGEDFWENDPANYFALDYWVKGGST